MKDEREVLTRKIVLGKLMREAKRTIVGALLMLLLSAIVFLALWLLFSSSGIASLLVGILYLVPLAVCLFFIFRALLVMSKANRGDFTVAEDTLESVENDKLNFWRLVINLGASLRLGDFTDNIFKFRSGRQFIANCTEYQNTHLNAAADFSQSGDKFIVVFYNDEPQKIVLLYSTKIYTYKEI